MHDEHIQTLHDLILIWENRVEMVSERREVWMNDSVGFRYRDGDTNDSHGTLQSPQ